MAKESLIYEPELSVLELALQYDLQIFSLLLPEFCTAHIRID